MLPESYDRNEIVTEHSKKSVGAAENKSLACQFEAPGPKKEG